MSDSRVKTQRKSRNKRLVAHFLNYKWWFLAGAVFLLITNAFALAIPGYIGQAVQLLRDSDETGVDRAALTDIAKMVILFAIGSGLARVGSRIFIFNAGRSVEFDIRNSLYRKLTELGERFYASMTTGDVTSRVTNDVTHIRLLYAISYLHIINTIAAYSIAIQRMVGLSVTLTAACLLSYPPLLLVIRKLIQAMYQQTIIVQSHLSTISSQVQENLAGITVIKTYAIEKRQREHFAQMNQEFVDKNMRLAVIRGGLFTSMAMMASMGTLIVLMVGSSQVHAQTLTLGEFVEFNGYVVTLAWPTVALGWVFSVWNRGIASFDRVSDILDRVSEVPEKPGAVTLPVGLENTGEVAFKNVTFGYDASKPILHNIDFTIEAGSTVAIVGRTGSGKTTLARLIARLYDPDQGELRIDGVPLHDLKLRETRSEIGMVPQEPFLFSMTIAQNMRFGLDALEFDSTVSRSLPSRSLINPEVESTQDERIWQALEIAGLKPDISGFPDQLETLVGERGITLSGGQKQRTTIARALLMDPRILVLDDALSSVDTQTEKVILDHLETIMAGRTSILITHRFNALDRVDKIFVLEQGRIVETGTHEELLNNDGTYAQLYVHQQLKDELAL